VLDCTTELRYIPLNVREDGGPVPLRRLPQNLAPNATAEERELAAAYWRGYPATAMQLQEAVAGGQRVAVLPEASDILIVDCDVRPDFQQFQKSGPAELVLYNGYDDLCREAEQGPVPFEIPPTYTVQTPSGGKHLYFRHNWKSVRADKKLTRSRGHRQDWRVDLKASVNSWAVAPPSPQYLIESGSVNSIAEMPYGMYRLFADFGRGARNQKPAPKVDLEASKGGILAFVEVAAGMKGMGWNNRIFWAACRYGEVESDIDVAFDELLGAAQPWNAGEVARAKRTIRSGWMTGREYSRSNNG
jgi:Bifunctional DNA primase/polymerase, N-terminal